MMSDSGNELAGFDPERYSGENISVEGQPVPGNVVEVAYRSGAGGAWAADGLTEVRGELLYADVRTEGISEGDATFVIQDGERGRAVAVDLELDVGKVLTDNIRSLKARKTKRGRRLGKARQVTFTDESRNVLAPVMNALRAVKPGDTIMVDGTEYGVVSVSEQGPDDRPSHGSAVLTRPDGSEYTLKTSQYSGEVTFKVRYGDELEIDPSSVQVGRFRERYYDFENEGLDTEDTDDAFPTPHGADVGERLTFTLMGEDGEDERVSGEVTNVRRYPRIEYYGMDADMMDPETAVELDDGREVKLRNASKSGSWVTRSRLEMMDDHGVVKAFVVTRYEDEDRENEYVHTTATDITPEGEDAPEVRTDGGVDVEGDGGEVPDHLDTWKYREGEDGEPVYVQDVEEPVAVEYEREDGADPSEGTLTYIQPDGESVTISPGDTILGPDGEDVVTVTGYCVTVDPYLAVEAYVDLPPEDGGGVPMSPLSFAIRFLGYEDRDGYHFHMDESVAASGEELEQARWADAVDTLRTLDVGDRILWGERSEPLTVTDTGLAISQYIRVEGPRGGEYTIRWRDSVPTVRRGGVQGDSLGRPHGLTVVSRAGEGGEPEVRTDGGRPQFHRCGACVREDSTGETAYTWDELREHRHGLSEHWPIDEPVDGGVLLTDGGEDVRDARGGEGSEGLMARVREVITELPGEDPELRDHPDGVEFRDGGTTKHPSAKPALTNHHFQFHFKPDARCRGGVNRRHLIITGSPTVPEVLMDASGGEWYALKVWDLESAYTDVTVYVIDNQSARARREEWGVDTGEICLSVEISGEDADRLDVSVSGDIRARERRPGTWDDVSLSFWTPYQNEDGEVVDDWTSLGTVMAAEQATDPREDGEDDDGEPEVRTDGGREPLNVSADEWADMGPLRFPRFPHTNSERVADEPTSMSVLTEGDVVVLDIGKHTGPRSKRRTPAFNRTAYRVEGTDYPGVCEFSPSDGRAARLKAKRGSWRRGSGSYELWTDVQRRSADAMAYRVLDAELETDGGRDPEALAGAVTDALRASDLPLSTLNVTITEPGDVVTITANGGSADRERWLDLRAHILRVLDAEGFQYRARDAWAFVEVTGGGPRADGGEVDAPPEPKRDPHTNAKQRAIALNIVQMTGTRRGPDGTPYLAVWRDADPSEDDLEGYHILMDLAGYTDLDPSVLDDERGGVDATGVTLDVWKQNDTGGGPDV